MSTQSTTTQTVRWFAGAAHAAALCGTDGAIRLVREDVGRHNAIDKLVGAVERKGYTMVPMWPSTERKRAA